MLSKLQPNLIGDWTRNWIYYRYGFTNQWNIGDRRIWRAQDLEKIEYGDFDSHSNLKLRFSIQIGKRNGKNEQDEEEETCLERWENVGIAELLIGEELHRRERGQIAICVFQFLIGSNSFYVRLAPQQSQILNIYGMRYGLRRVG